MRKLLNLSLAVLFAGAALLVACDRLPNEPTETQELEGQASQEGTPAGMLAERAWGNDHLWRFFIPQTVVARLNNSDGVMPFGSPADDGSDKPLYIIGPEAGNDGPQADHGSGPHDHVIPVPPKNNGTFTAVCNIRGVFPSPSSDADVAASGSVPFAHAADTDGDGDVEDLTSADKVQKAESRGHVIIRSSPLVFTCPVKDIEG